MKATGTVFLVPAVILSLAGLPALAQSVISAQSGLLNYAEGQVLINDRAVQPQRGQFPQMREQDTLRTEQSRAELLLNPGAFLRVGRNSSIRMITGRITDSRFELLSGTVLLEAADIRKDNAVTVVHGDATITILKRGLYRLSADPATLRVFDGKARVESGGQQVELGKGKMLSFGDTLTAAKFSRKETDTLDRWSSRRAEYLARANVSAATSLRGQAGGWRANGWGLSPAFGVFTYIPRGGIAYSPYGYSYWSPPMVYQAYSYGAQHQASGGVGGGSPGPAGGSASGPGPSAGGPSGAGVSQSSSRPASPADHRPANVPNSRMERQSGR